jgi:hypothetical protein
MPQSTDNLSPSTPAHLLKAAAAVVALLGGGMAAWGLDKWIRYPEARASQFGFEAPLWPAFVGFAVLATVVMVWLFWTAARRVENGENLFAQRHRERRSLEDTSNGYPSGE